MNPQNTTPNQTPPQDPSAAPQPSSNDGVPVFQNPLAQQSPDLSFDVPQPYVPPGEPEPNVAAPELAPEQVQYVEPPILPQPTVEAAYGSAQEAMQPEVVPAPLQESAAPMPAAAPTPIQIHPAPYIPAAAAPVPVPAPENLPQPAPAPISPLATPEVAPAQPTINRVSEEVIGPAPVRLAAVPRADDAHGVGAQSTSQAIPFGGATIETPQGSVMPVGFGAPVAGAKKKGRGLRIVMVLFVLILVLGGAGYAASQLIPKKSTTPSPEPTAATGTITRDTTERPIQPFAEKTSTDCYIVQTPIPKFVQQNKDCSLSLTYGEQKIASIVVSPQREFDIVSGENQTQSTQNSANGTVRFDTQKYLDALIARAVTSDLIVTKETIQVAGLSATKVVGRTSASATPAVAYVFIVLPETDRKFQEKTFIAFIVTGAYNDDYSRKGFDQAIASWSWK